MTNEERMRKLENDIELEGLCFQKYLGNGWTYTKLYQVTYFHDFNSDIKIGFIDDELHFVEVIYVGGKGIVEYKLKSIEKIHYTKLEKFKKIIEAI